MECNTERMTRNHAKAKPIQQSQFSEVNSAKPIQRKCGVIVSRVSSAFCCGMDLPPAHFAENGLAVVTFADGCRYVVRENSWAFVYPGHVHKAICAPLSAYLGNKANPKIWNSESWWNFSDCHVTLVENANGEKVCFWCELARLAPDARINEIQQLYLEATCLSEKQGGDLDALWIPMAQSFYESKGGCSAPKPARS